MYNPKKLPASEISSKKVILTSFTVDFIDVILSLAVAIITGSIIMLSELLEAVADLTASAFLIIGLNRAQKTPDKSHPFGYGRELYFWTLISALLMFGFTATFSFYLGWQRFINPQPIHNINFAFVVLAVALFSNGYSFSLSLRRLLRKRNFNQIGPVFFRSSLVETKTTFILDLMGTTAAFLGLIALYIYRISGDLRYDGLGAMVIGVVLAILSYFLILSIRDLVVGKSASRAVEEQIRKTTFSIPEVKEVMDLKTMHIGSEKLLVNIEVNLEDNLTTNEIEKLIDKIKDRIQKEIPQVKHIQVELETA